MSNRIYQIVAVATLVGAPIVVHVISNALPGVRQAAQDQDESEAKSAGAAPVQTAAVTPAPQPQTQAQQQDVQPSADPAVEATPSLDTQGIAPAVAEVSSEAPPPPPMPVQPAHKPVADDDVGPPPPRKPDWMNR